MQAILARVLIARAMLMCRLKQPACCWPDPGDSAAAASPGWLFNSSAPAPEAARTSELPDVQKEVGAQKHPEVFQVVPAHQVSHRVAGRQPVHAQNFGEVFVDALCLIDIVSPAEARYFRIIAPPDVAQPDQKIPQRNVAPATGSPGRPAASRH